MNRNFICRAALLFFATFTLSLFLFPGAASALTLTPIRFEITGDPGQKISEEILLVNEGTSVECYYSSFANFEAQGDSGTPAFVPSTDGIGTWISTPVNSVCLDPRQQKIVPFDVNIPLNAEPGGHFGVIFWGTSPPGGSGMVAVGSQTGILVLLSVKGDVTEEAGLLNFNTVGEKFFYQTLPVSFEYRFRNDGGDRIKPSGTLTISNTLFIPTQRLDGNPVEGNVLPNSTRKININWVKYERPNEYMIPNGAWGKFWSNVHYQWRNFALGLYSARLNVAYGTHGEHAKGTAWFFVFPWQLVLVLLVIIIILYWGGKILIGRYNKYIIEKARAGMNHVPPDSSHG